MAIKELMNTRLETVYLFVYSFTHSFNLHLWSNYYMTGMCTIPYNNLKFARDGYFITLKSKRSDKELKQSNRDIGRERGECELGGDKVLSCALKKRRVYIGREQEGVFMAGGNLIKRDFFSGNGLGMLGNMEMALQHRAQSSLL